MPTEIDHLQSGGDATEGDDSGALDRRSERAWLWLAALITALTFIGTLRFGFVYDDYQLIVNNPRIESWRNVGSFFSHHLFAHLYATGNYYRPLYLVWFLIGRTLFGLNPALWHAATLAWHVAATIAVFYLARRITRSGVAAGFAALVFGVHPAHIESIAWCSAPCDAMITLLMIASYLLFARRDRNPGRRVVRTIASAVLYGVALLIKEPAIVLPALLAADEWMRLRVEARPIQRTLVSLLPCLGVTAVYLALRIWALGGFMHVDHSVSFATFLWTLPSVAWFYVAHLVWPVGISLFYDTPFVTRPDLTTFGLPLIGCGAVAIASWIGSRRSRAVALASVWMILPILPALNGIRTIGAGDIAHDRYLYVSSAGFCILVAMALVRLPALGSEVLGVPSLRAGTALVIAGALAAGSAAQSVQWASNVLLFHRAVERAPRNPIARVELATAMMARGDTASAMRLYHEAHQLAPDDWLVNFLLGYANYGLGQYSEAEHYLREAIRISPASSSEFVYLGMTLARERRFDEAERVLRDGAARFHPPPPALAEALRNVEAERSR